ncbi:MAG: hypothetical protein HKM02_01840 [Pseudomonadales bacterium]|nr:hypothetical protein [Pseudomonadales bacterium]
MTLARLRYTGPYGAGVEYFWRHQVHDWMHKHGLLGHVRYGIGYDDPAITAPELCRYDAAVLLDAESPQDGLDLMVLPGGGYVCRQFRGTVGEVAEAWQLIHQRLLGRGPAPDGRLCFESYPLTANFDPQTGIFDAELWYPDIEVSNPST